MTSIAQVIRRCGGRTMARKQSASVWCDEYGRAFAYSFSDGSAIIYGFRTIVCSARALERWCNNGRVDKLLVF